MADEQATADKLSFSHKDPKASAFSKLTAGQAKKIRHGFTQIDTVIKPTK